jgi:signal transduction histidine kinase
VGQYGAPEADKVFDKFYRAPAAISLSGSGLGLFIVKQLAQLMLAKVEYAHRGTQVMFTVRLPGFDADEII